MYLERTKPYLIYITTYSYLANIIIEKVIMLSMSHPWYLTEYNFLMAFINGVNNMIKHNNYKFKELMYELQLRK